VIDPAELGRQYKALPVVRREGSRLDRVGWGDRPADTGDVEAENFNGHLSVRVMDVEP
jgi:hypothetical protein